MSIACLVPVAHANGDKHYVDVDLGTINSCVGVHRGERVEILANDQGNRITPLWVTSGGEEQLIGDAAKAAFHTSPPQTMIDANRLVGHKFDDTELKHDMMHWPFKVVNKGGKPMILIQDNAKLNDFTKETSAMILTKMKETAEAYLDRQITHAIVIVPTYFNDTQCQATKDTGTVAGLTILCIINKPTAAAITYGLDKRDGESQIIVYDLGGGTFDVSLLSIDDGVFEGAAIQGGSLSGEEGAEDVVLIDVCSLTIGIESTGDVLTKLVSRNTVIPTKESQIFATVADNQPTVLNQVCEGERSLAEDNNLLGESNVSHPPVSPTTFTFAVPASRRSTTNFVPPITNFCILSCVNSVVR